MLDLHTHILPDVDDGPETWEDALGMLAVAEAQGTHTIVATPHSHGAWQRHEAAADLVPELVAEAQQRARAVGLSLRILPGQECYIDVDLVSDLEAGRLLTLGTSRTVLLELPFTQWPARTEHLIYDLQVAGYTVLLAHPERYTAVQKEPNLVLPLVERGVYLQVTSVAITGELGAASQRCARVLVEHGLCHVLASDAHHVRRRAPVLDTALAEMTRWIGEEAARQMVQDIPQALLEDRSPRPLLEPRPVRPSPRGVRRLFRDRFL